MRDLPTRWRRKPAGTDRNQNYVTVALCVHLSAVLFTSPHITLDRPYLTWGCLPKHSINIGCSDVTESMVTIRSPFCGYNMTQWVELGVKIHRVIQIKFNRLFSRNYYYYYYYSLLRHIRQHTQIQKKAKIHLKYSLKYKKDYR